jgi:prephenate dehydratase
LSKTRQWAPVDSARAMTTFIFRVRNVPAALFKALGGFATNGVNMTKLESYMVDGEFAATRFLVDVDGHPEQPALARAFEELAFFSKEVEILGVYPAAEFRITNIRAFEYGD